VATLFDEILFDPALLRFGAGEAPPVTGSPEFANTDIRNEKTGVHKINVNRFDAIENLNISLEMKDDDEVGYFLKMWRGGYGSAVGFRVRVPHDYFVTEEAFGLGDGVATEFPLYVTYTRPGVTARQDVRRIIKPVAAETQETNSFQLYEPAGLAARVITTPFAVYVDGVEDGHATVDVTTGIVTLSFIPDVGLPLTWNGEFDVPMAFVGNSFSLRKDIGGQAQGLTLREILPAELEID
jgi:hypothetical protein